MNKRPLSITVVGWIFICVGIVAATAGTWRFIAETAHEDSLGNSRQNAIDLALVWVSALMAVVGGVFVLRHAMVFFESSPTITGAPGFKDVLEEAKVWVPLRLLRHAESLVSARRESCGHMATAVSSYRC